MPESKDDTVRRVATSLCAQPTSLPANKRLAEIAALLYAYRNDQLSDAEISSWPQDGKSEDPEVMAAVEHYFFARSQVANAEYSAVNMKAMINAYQWAKRMGFDLRHNKSNPTTAPSPLQKTWATLGADQGQQDLASLNKSRRKSGAKPLSPPNFRLPPNFAGKYGSHRTDQVKY